MKSILVCSAVLVAALMGGCASIAPQKLPVQEILSATLPPDFVGNKHIDHSNPWVQFSVDFVGLKRDAASGLWTWKQMRYAGHSAVTTTNIQDIAPSEKP